MQLLAGSRVPYSMQLAAWAGPRPRTWYTLAAITAFVGGLVATTGGEPLVIVEPPPLPVIDIEKPAPAPQSAIEIVAVAAHRQITRDEPLPLTFYAVNRTTETLPVLR